MQNIKYRYRNQIPFKVDQVNKVFLKGLDGLAKEQLETFKSELFAKNNVQIYLLANNQLIKFFNDSNEVIQIYLTDQGVLINLNMYYVNQIIENQYLEHVFFNVPDERVFSFERDDFEFEKSQRQEIPEITTKTINPALYEELKKTFNPTEESLVFETMHSNQKVILKLIPEKNQFISRSERDQSNIFIPSKYIDIYEELGLTTHFLLFVKKSTYLEQKDGSFEEYLQIEEIKHEQIKKLMKEQENTLQYYTYPLIRNHLKKINPLLIYFTLPTLSTKKPNFKDLHLFDAETVPDRFRLMFCTYQAFIIQKQNFIYNMVIGDIQQEIDQLDFSKVAIDCSDFRTMFVQLLNLTNRSHSTQSSYQTQQNEDFEALFSFGSALSQITDQTYLDTMIKAQDFILYQDEQGVYQYIRRLNSNDEWYHSEMLESRPQNFEQVKEKSLKSILVRYGDFCEF